MLQHDFGVHYSKEKQESSQKNPNIPTVLSFRQYKCVLHTTHKQPLSTLHHPQIECCGPLQAMVLNHDLHNNEHHKKAITKPSIFGSLLSYCWLPPSATCSLTDESMLEWCNDCRWGSVVLGCILHCQKLAMSIT